MRSSSTCDLDLLCGPVVVVGVDALDGRQNFKAPDHPPEHTVLVVQMRARLVSYVELGSVCVGA